MAQSEVAIPKAFTIIIGTSLIQRPYFVHNVALKSYGEVQIPRTIYFVKALINGRTESCSTLPSLIIGITSPLNTLGKERGTIF